jgi:protein SCO1/2
MTRPVRRLRAAIAAGVPLLVLLVGCGGDQPSQAAGDNPGGVVVSGVDEGAFNGAEPAAPYRMPDVTLTATNGEPFNLITDTGYPVTLVFFGYTHCPDVCPLVLQDATAALNQLPSDVRDETQLLFVTTDPARDTPDVVRQYLDRFDPDFVGLTGRLPRIIRAADAMGVAIEGMKRLPSGGYEVGHGAQVIGFAGNEAPVIWTQGTPVPDMAEDIVTLAGR